MNSPLSQFAESHTSLFWDISQKRLSSLDDSTILERVWCYGNWEEYKHIESIIGRKRAKDIFIERVFTPRTNLREETINLFILYFDIDATLPRTLSRAI